ncbi:MAG: formylglycine-generating enzyme family protein, partial [Oligoflexia bacterium]|nr:formylglycine-generating enzyme family protein [Oligoflexia bacterium]
MADCDDNDPLVTPLTERYLPAGDAWEGRDDPDKARSQRVVTLSAYCVDITEVDNDHLLPFLQQVLDKRGALVDDQDRLLYDLVDGDDEVPERIEQDGNKLSVVDGYGDHPTVEITWYGAEAYCESQGQRLPTEAEWERAANGGCGEDGCDSSIPPIDWPWGDDEPDCDPLNGALLVTGSEGDAMPKW